MRTMPLQPVRLRRFLPALCGMLTALSVQAQTVLEADGTTNTYALIESVLGAGTADETPDCAHPEFGPHITQSWDNLLGKYVFNFFIHVSPDDDRCIIFDRQRNEIKTMSGSPAYLLASEGETTSYRWYFKLDAGFQPSANFTHIHQIKADNGGLDDSMPLITISPYTGSPETLRILYAPPIEFGGSQAAVTSAPLSSFKGQWIEATEKMLNSSNGTYEIVLKKVSDGSVLLSYTNNNIIMWRGGDSSAINRPKWGIYRSLSSSNYLRDEVVQFADFSLAKGSYTFSNTPPSITTAPVDTTGFRGQSISFTVEASGTLPLYYRWRFNTTNDLSWATTATMTLTNMQSVNEGDYSVVVTNAYGAVTSSVAALTVIVGSNNVFTAAGGTNWICPDGITSVQVECWGGGGAGGSARREVTNSIGTGGGGAGGAYAKVNFYAVTPGNTYYINVGAGGVSLTNNGNTVSGGDSWFNTNNSPSAVIIAKGGAGGESVVVNVLGVSRYGAGGAGSSSGSSGDIVYAGGSGATSTSNFYGGGGGGSGGTSTNGNSATENTGLGATAVNGGGNGGNPNPVSGSSGSGQTPTTPPGGGGGGARAGSSTQQTGGTGGAGQVVLTYTTDTVNVAPSVSLTAPTNNASYTAPASIALTATASDTDGTVTNVGFYNGSTLIGSDITSPYAYTWTNVLAGSYSLPARATDNSGAVSTSAVAAITVVNPVYTLTGSAGANGTVSPASTNVLAGNSAAFVITASNYYRIATLTTNGTAVTGMYFDNNSTSTNFIWSNVQTSGVLAVTFTNQVTTNAPAGVPYEWLAGYGLTNYDTDAVADQDADGLKAWQEYIAGTNPTNTTSCFKAAQATRNTITWAPQSNRIYSVYWSTNLIRGFTALNTNILYPQGSYTNATPDSRVNHYQIKVRLQ